eukprot:5225311-Pyramimonas_sp.AAC.1
MYLCHWTWCPQTPYSSDTDEIPCCASEACASLTMMSLLLAGSPWMTSFTSSRVVRVSRGQHPRHQGTLPKGVDRHISELKHAIESRFWNFRVRFNMCCAYRKNAAFKYRFDFCDPARADVSA